LVIQCVHADWQRHPEHYRELLGDLLALFQRLGIGDKNFVLEVLWYLPAIRGMSFADVNNPEMSFVLVRGKQFFDRPDRGAKRRSGATAED
jgi:hypothetical protein